GRDMRVQRIFIVLGCLGILMSSTLYLRGLGAEKPNAEPPRPPLGLPPIFWPEENPYTPEKAELGRLLFYDKRLSSDASVSCASCHDPKFAFTDGSAVATGIKLQKGGRSAPTVINRAYSTAQFWDGRAPT